MQLYITQIINTIIQIIIFCLIPLVCWFIKSRKKERFFTWIGLKSIYKSNIKEVILLSCIVVLSFMGLSIYILFLLRDVELATSEFKGLGITALPVAILYSFIKTGLCEEILFRGFILKRLSSKVGFAFANIIQSGLFGLLHGVLFFNIVNNVVALIIIIFTTIIGWLMGYINEQKANGSIVPSWIIHGMSNLFSSIIALFSLI